MATSAEKKRVLDWFTRWQETMNLNHWTITVKYREENKNEESAADTIRDFDYLRATINVYPCFFGETLEIQWSHVAHEMTHVMLNDYDQALWNSQAGLIPHDKQIKKIQEQTTTQFTSLLMKAWPYNKKKLKRERK